MATLSFHNVNKVYDNKVQAVFDFNLEVADKEFIVFVGPSGCGKSTTLRMIAGLEGITSGEIYIDGKLINDLPPKDRDIAMVFQNYALYPHLTVYQNLQYALKLRKIDFGDGKPRHYTSDEIDKKIREIANILALESYLRRKPAALSGGQRQRVALGRAIVRNPKVFLMDEPLSNLDAKLRVSMRSEIAKIHKNVGATTIYVTHDQTEAMTMASRIVIMKDGWIQQIGTPEEVYKTPANIFVATFIGSPAMNILTGVYKQSKLYIGDNIEVTLPKDFKKVHDEFYQKELVEAQKNRDEFASEFDNFIQQVGKKKKYRKFIAEKTEELQKLDSIIEGFKSILNGEEHNLSLGIRPEDIYLSSDKAAENKSKPLTLSVDFAELLGNELILYTYINGEKVLIKSNSKFNVQTNDQIEAVYNTEKITIFDTLSTDRIY